ncbi:peptidase C39 family protein [Leucobacter salsicius]|uniref:peptidase C39 family protein n=1 Tax=Leucobacter salsicius TaxID=664638 RepID=UPI00034BEAA1|nr:peptidase C39 family protein [Leucobacter salsicius]
MTAHVSTDVSVPTGYTVDPARAALWETARELWAPRHIAAGNGEERAVALVAGRAHTAYRKIVDVLAPDAAGFARAVAAAVADRSFVDATHPAPILIRFEEHPTIAPLDETRQAALRELGFERDPDPVPSVPSTRPGEPAHARSWSLWLGDRPQRTVPYYGQTTDVTCGAVTALMMLEQEGLTKFGDSGDANQEREIDFWRRATNLPACDPVGLAVTTAREISSEGLAVGAPKVFMSAAGLVLLEDFQDDPYELRLREQLQHDSLRQAAALGLEIERRWIEVAEIRDLVAAGNDVFLLIALAPLIGDPAPHWVLAHDVIDDALIVSDPWVEAAHGESWVDTSCLPIPLAGIDLIMRWGDPEYRGAIVVPR